MKLELKRIARRSTYTIGRLYIDGHYFCDTLEPTERKLTSSMSVTDIRKIKVKGRTAIPTGTYPLDLNTFSPRFGRLPFYQKSCRGKVPTLIGVKGFDRILIHAGNSAEDTEGCILLGENKTVGRVINSRVWCEKLYALLMATKTKPVITIS